MFDMHWKITCLSYCKNFRITLYFDSLPQIKNNIEMSKARHRDKRTK